MGRESDKVSREMRKAVNLVSRNLVLDVNRRLAEATPIDTAWARSNWIPSKDSPVESPAGTQEDVDLTAAQSGVNDIRSWDLFKGPAFIANNVPYINDLNAGSSDQAPPGFVQEGIEQGIKGLNNRVLR